MPSHLSNELDETIKQLLHVNPHFRPSCDKILKFSSFCKWENKLFPNYKTKKEDELNILLKTIKFPKNFLYLTDQLPKPAYNIETIQFKRKNSTDSELIFPAILPRKKKIRHLEKIIDYKGNSNDTINSIIIKNKLDEKENLNYIPKIIKNDEKSVNLQPIKLRNVGNSIIDKTKVIDIEQYIKEKRKRIPFSLNELYLISNEINKNILEGNLNHEKIQKNIYNQRKFEENKLPFIESKNKNKVYQSPHRYNELRDDSHKLKSNESIDRDIIEEQKKLFYLEKLKN